MNTKKTFFAIPYVACLTAMLCCLLWGSAFPFLKIGLNEWNITTTAAKIYFAGIRFMIAGIAVIVVGSIITKKILYPNRKAIPKVLAISLFQTILQYVFYYVGVSNTTGVKSAIIVGTNVFTVVLFSCFIFRLEKLSMKVLFGCIIGFTGVILVNLQKGGFDTNFRLIGEGFVLLSTILYAFSPILMKKYSQTEDAIMLSGWQFFAGGVIMIIIGILMNHGFIPFIEPSGVKAYINLGYLSFVSAAAYTLWAMLLKYNPVSKITVYGFMNPVFGVFLSAWLLGERKEAFQFKSLLALLLVSAGIFIVNYNKAEKRESK